MTTKTEKKTKTVKKAAKTEKKPEKKPYYLKVQYNDTVFETNAKSLEEALTEFAKDPQFNPRVKTKIVLTYGNEDVSKTALYNVNRARRMFSVWNVKGDNSISIFARLLEQALH